jgi:hypothetical protein
VVATLVIVNWEPPQGRGDRRRPAPTSVLEDVESFLTDGTLPCRVRSRFGGAT